MANKLLDYSDSETIGTEHQSEVKSKKHRRWSMIANKFVIVSYKSRYRDIKYLHAYQYIRN